LEQGSYQKMATVAHSVAIANSHRDLLNENLGAVIENPLGTHSQRMQFEQVADSFQGHLNEEQLLKDVELFARNKSLDDLLPGLKRAALVAQNIMVYDQVARNARSGDGLPVQLTPDEKAALRNERDTLFSQSMGLYMTVLTVSIAGILQGHVQSSINSATLLFPQAFGLDVNTSYGEWIVGVTNAAPFIFAAVL
jgi:hypothetical protein